MSGLQLRLLDSGHPTFAQALDRLLARGPLGDAAVEQSVAQIIRSVRTQGDTALLEYTRRFDGFEVRAGNELEFSAKALDGALDHLPEAQREALSEAASRIRNYHQRQCQDPWDYTEADGTRLGQRVTPMDRVGIYVPGGKASYPSSVLMTAIPARVAGVGEIVMAVPTPGGHINDIVLAAARLAGVDRVFRIGGAHAIAALAYGTASVPAVDKIVGPGNVYVATAKRMVFGQVGIDMIAGPSEVVIVVDGSTDPEWVAMDLFAQAEHDELAQSILIAVNPDALEQVRAAIHRLLPTLERREIIKASLEGQGALIAVQSLEQAADIVNRIAPEHLQLMVAEPDALMHRIRHAGAIFVGPYSAEALGDYCAGPNHVLPTTGTARFSSPLGVYDFQKRTSLIMCSRRGGAELAKTAVVLARCEELTAHARSAQYRMQATEDP